MAVIIEDGTGVASANSYITADFVTAYLTERNRETENGWTTASAAAKDAAVVAAGDYIELKYAQRFAGQIFWPNLSFARASLTFTGQPADTETVTLGADTYTFVAALSTAYDVLIGANTAESIQNLINAICALSSALGVTIGTGTVVNADAVGFLGFGDIMGAQANDSGTGGNSIVSTTTVANASWNFATLLGGNSYQIPQPVSFPRAFLYLYGILVQGIPLDLQNAQAEYAVRALSATLAPDPTTDPLGGSVISTRVKVGPIEDETHYLGGTTGNGSLLPYPAADRLLNQYTTGGGGQGGVIRG